MITSLGIGEAVVTVMNERGAPTPVAWTRLRAPESLMGPSDPAAMAATVQASPRYAKYAETVDRESAREKLAVRRRRRTMAGWSGTSLTDFVGQLGVLAALVLPAEPYAKPFMRTAAREIARGMFKTARR